MPSKRLLVIAGPNGSGKSSLVTSAKLAINRDVNAARNILARTLSQIPQGSAGDPRPGFVRAEKPAV